MEMRGVDEEVAESDVLSKGLPEVSGEGVHDGGAVESEGLEGAGDLEELVEGLGGLVLALVDGGVGDVDEGDARREGEVVEDEVDAVVHVRVAPELDGLELLRPHEPVRHFLHHHRREVGAAEVELEHPLVLAQHLRHRRRHSLRHREVVHLQHAQVLSHQSQRL